MNFDEVNVQQLHAQTFQTIDLFQLKTIWSDCLPDASYRVTDFSELNLHVTKPQLLQLRWIDLTLPIGIYSNEALVFLYNPYVRTLHTKVEVSLEQPSQDLSIVDFLFAQSQTFHDPDSYSVKMEDAYGLLPNSQWREFGLPKVKEPVAFMADISIILGVTSFQVVTCKSKCLIDFESWAKRTGIHYTVESSGKWLGSKMYTVTCDVLKQSEQAILQLLSLLEHYEEWEGARFFIATETGTVSLFVGGDLTEGYGFGVFQYEQPGKAIPNES